MFNTKLTRNDLKLVGIRYRRLKWRWLQKGYRLETTQFDRNGEFWNMTYPQYLSFWAEELNKYLSWERYVVLWMKRWGNWWCTLVELDDEDVKRILEEVK